MQISAVLLVLAVLIDSVLAGPEVTAGVIAARGWTTWGKTASAGPASLVPVVSPGDTIFLRAYHGKNLDAESGLVRARHKRHGARQAFVIEKREAGAIYPGDRIFLTAGNGNRLEVDGTAVLARSQQKGPKQEFYLERMNDSNNGPIRVGDTIFLRAHTGNHVDVVGDAVRARLPRQGFGYNTLVVEKPN
mmetsp:Transcript_25641/g.41082  ORF Transcript_25641/g.41082 Transcript_25641/m.41082 type:complete len:190 (-) Transcript_25641:92-661(-)